MCRSSGCASAMDQSRLCAEWCAHLMPQHDWAPLVGLVHNLGRILAHPQCAFRVLASGADHADG